MELDSGAVVVNVPATGRQFGGMMSSVESTQAHVPPLQTAFKEPVEPSTVKDRISDQADGIAARSPLPALQLGITFPISMVRLKFVGLA
jgi:hypothetical protein